MNPSLFEYPQYGNYEQQFFQCQELFMQWYQKLSNLIYEEQHGSLANISASMEDGWKVEPL
jgi:hypothetical protein